MRPLNYGIVDRNEHGRIIVRPTGVHDLKPGAMVEIRPIDEAPTAQADEVPQPLPEVRGMVLA